MAELMGVATWFAISGLLIVIVGIGTFFVPAVRDFRREESKSSE
ncbi:hypothetical protein [Brevibacillus choshinensis]|nr:hypothetical protein [Brevibacillus choshinensis]